MSLWQIIKNYRAEKRAKNALVKEIAKAMAPRREYRISPSGTDMWVAQYRTHIPKDRRTPSWNDLGYFKTQQDAQAVIETNLKVFAASIADRVREIERTYDHPPYTYPDAWNYSTIFHWALDEALKAKGSDVRRQRVDQY